MWKTSLFIALIFLASQALMVAPQIITDSIEPASSDLAPDHNDGGFPDSVPSLSPEESSHLNYLEECAAKVGEECGEKVFSSIFKGETYDDKCCNDLVGMGKDCHDAMITFLANLPEFKGKASSYLSISDAIWNECVVVASSPSS